MENSEKTVSFWYQLLQKNQNFIFRVFTINLVIFGYLFLFGLIVPSAGEAWAYNITLILGILSACFIGLIAASGIGIAVFFSSLMLAWGVKHVRKEIKRDGGQTQYALPESLSGDILYIEDTAATNPENLARIEAYRAKIKDGCYLCLLLYRNPLIVFECGTKSWAINRSELETSGFDYSRESVLEFTDFAQMWRTKFAAYCAERKTSLGVNAMDVAITSLRVTATIALLLFASVLGAQKTEIVKSALGASANAKPREGSEVVYSFQKGDIKRTATGAHSIAELITHQRPATVDANDKGAFVGCSVDGIAIATVAVNKQPDNAKPAPLMADVATTKPINLAIPDSVTAQRAINEIDKEIKEGSKDIGRFSAQWFYSDTFRLGTNILLLLFLVFRFISNTATNETRVNAFGGTAYGGWALTVGQFVKFAAWILGLIVIVPVLITFGFYFLDGEIGKAFGVFFNFQIGAFIALALIFTFFEWILDYLLKNPKQIGGGLNDNRGVSRFNQ